MLLDEVGGIEYLNDRLTRIRLFLQLTRNEFDLVEAIPIQPPRPISTNHNSIISVTFILGNIVLNERELI